MRDHKATAASFKLETENSTKNASSLRGLPYIIPLKLWVELHRGRYYSKESPHDVRRGASLLKPMSSDLHSPQHLTGLSHFAVLWVGAPEPMDACAQALSFS